MAITLDDVGWDRKRFLARASQTEHAKDGGLRWVALFPELWPHLETLWEPEIGPASTVITRYR